MGFINRWPYKYAIQKLSRVLCMESINGQATLKMQIKIYNLLFCNFSKLTKPITAETTMAARAHCKGDRNHRPIVRTYFLLKFLRTGMETSIKKKLNNSYNATISSALDLQLPRPWISNK